MKLIKIVMVLLLLLSGGTLALFWMLSPGETSPFVDGEGRVVEGSVASIEFVELGGVEQFVLMRGRDRTKPVLLFLHGGPGNPEAPHLNHFNRTLEDHFVVVNWDQRGAGRSYSSEIAEATMTVDQFVADLHQLTEWLKRRFGQDKIYLMGHSWGSYIGILAAHRYPQNYHAYIGIGQVTDQRRSEMISYRFTLERAEAVGNREAVEELAALGPPVNGEYRGGALDMLKQRKWVREFGGAMVQSHRFIPSFVLPILLFREYRLMDKWGYFEGEEFSVRLLFDQVLDSNLFERIDRLELPVYFMQGREDYQTAYILAEQFMGQLDAPEKGLITFENSAHMVFMEESDRFVEELLRIVNRQR